MDGQEKVSRSTRIFSILLKLKHFLFFSVLSPLTANLEDCRAQVNDASYITWPFYGPVDPSIGPEDDFVGDPYWSMFTFPEWPHLSGIQTFCMWDVKIDISYMGSAVNIKFVVDPPKIPSYGDNMYWGFSDFGVVLCKEKCCCFQQPKSLSD